MVADVTFSFLWFVAGAAIGVNVTLAYAWLTLRHANRKAARRLNRALDDVRAGRVTIYENDDAFFHSLDDESAA